MNEFRILSIDELDEEFVTKLRVPSEASEAKTLIPEFVKTENEVSGNEDSTYAEPIINQTANIINEYLSSDPKPVTHPTQIKDENGMRPIIPLGQGKPFYSPDGNISEPKALREEDFEINDKPQKQKGYKGLIFARIFCIIMLVSTLLTFISGCFVSVFLNNSIIDLKGISFNTLAVDVTLTEEKLNAGDLIISKRYDYESYCENLNRPLAVPVEGAENSGCIIEYIENVSEGDDGSAEITTYDPVTGKPLKKIYNSEHTYGVVLYYVPLVGSILNFALNSPILICVLFVLMIAFWCLLMILVEKTIKKRKSNI